MHEPAGEIKQNHARDEVNAQIQQVVAPRIHARPVVVGSQADVKQGAPGVREQFLDLRRFVEGSLVLDDLEVVKNERAVKGVSICPESKSDKNHS